ncbi:MAG: type 4a pilus biogenesis protein PilO [Syntrophorhabdaceae bacterium]|nr:type 4a pilus biogenesis protein PilO [Syntrophorhabdaceae bacterium]
MNLKFDIKPIIKKISKVKRLYKLLFSITFNLIVFGLLFYFLIIPQIDKKHSKIEEYNKVTQELQKMVFIKNNMTKFRNEHEELKELLQRVLKQLPETKDIPNFLRNIANVSAESRVKITYFEPKALQPKEFFAELPFTVRFSGPYHHVGYFFDGIRRLDRIINITSFDLNIEPKSPPGQVILNGECTGKTYVYLKEQPKAQPKK